MKKSPQRKKVAILGFTTHNQYAPWTDDSWELWGLNDLHSTFEDFAPGIFGKSPERIKWFQLHRPELDGSYHGNRDPKHHEWLTQQAFPIYMWNAHPDIPQAVAYPIQEILRYFLQNGGAAYFNNSISWMIALAIVQGYKEISVYGVDMALEGVHGQSEYGHQRPSVEYFLGIAWGKGIKLTLHPESEILKTAYLYGWDNVSPAVRKLTARFHGLSQQEAGIVSDYEACKRSLHEIRGAIAERQSILRTRAIIDATPRAAEVGTEAEKLDALIAQVVDVADERLNELRINEQNIVNEYEAIKRSLHEVRGSKNNTEWFLRNYCFVFGGEIQDVPRTERSIVDTPEGVMPLAALPPMEQPSDGKSKNRIVAALKGA